MRKIGKWDKLIIGVLLGLSALFLVALIFFYWVLTSVSFAP
ncbi:MULTISPECIES: hypothetical protein [Paenibacillus]|uniref:Uncharacterized protein n=1 Tax=Paenibacillus amylolyticus TaxID=1451 RepID=A0AAP5H508_PAEAM|nr:MULTISPECIES: hypothetical protein [Paenibacillus]MDR6725350.1 hypothetical protein [Paenibacillus amylolyticus]